MPRIGILVHSTRTSPFAPGEPLHSFDPDQEPGDQLTVSVIQALVSFLLQNHERKRPVAVGRLPSGQWVAVTIEEGVYNYAIMNPEYVHSSRRIKVTGPICVVDNAPPFEPEEARAILDFLFEGTYWDDVEDLIRRREADRAQLQAASRLHRTD